jgi:hypothetical protein
MTTAEQIAAEIRAPGFFKVRQSFGPGPGRKHDIYVTREEFPGWYEDLIAERVAWATSASAEAAAAANDQARLRQLLGDVESGTAAQALAALRVLVPRLVQREIRESR